jgi:cation:H+ antiporter
MGALIGELLALSFVVLFVGSLLVRYAEEFADITGFGHAFVGAFFLAIATSMPEIVIDSAAVLKGMPNLAVGDLFGSCLFNLLILGVADLVHKERGVILGPSASRYALAGVLSIAVVCVVALSVLLNRLGYHYSVMGIGYGPVVVVLIYFLGSRMVFRDKSQTSDDTKSVTTVLAKRGRMTLLLIRYLFCVSALLVIGPELARVANAIAIESGVSQMFIGTTMVAAITSLPELVSTIVAVRRGSFGLAAGNIFGSNAFNMVVLMPLDFLYNGNLLGGVDVVHLLTCMSVVFITAVAVSGQLYQVPQRIRFIDPDAWLVVGLVFGALFLIYDAQNRYLG